jgi:hypothetical protein
MKTEDHNRGGITAILRKSQIRLIGSVSAHSEICDVASQPIGKYVSPVLLWRRRVSSLGKGITVERHAASFPQTIREVAITLRPVHVQIVSVLPWKRPAKNRVPSL